jgi:hypothetical protein
LSRRSAAGAKAAPPAAPHDYQSYGQAGFAGHSREFPSRERLSLAEGIVPDIDDEHIVPSPTMTVFSVPRADSRLEAEPRKTQWTVRF